MLALCLMLLGTYYTLPIMLALCLMLLGTYYAQNYAGIIGRSPRVPSHVWIFIKDFQVYVIILYVAIKQYRFNSYIRHTPN